jgi:hypothetical protein
MGHLRQKRRSWIPDQVRYDEWGRFATDYEATCNGNYLATCVNGHMLPNGTAILGAIDVVFGECDR